MEAEIGHVTHYFNKINVAVLSIKDELRVGDMIHILGHTTDLTQKVTSLQIEHKNVDAVKPGDDFALKEQGSGVHGHCSLCHARSKDTSGICPRVLQ